ncbi:hypothetical protein ABZ570_33040 [Micromonospora sp. NPDC007271]
MADPVSASALVVNPHGPTPSEPTMDGAFTFVAGIGPALTLVRARS